MDTELDLNVTSSTNLLLADDSLEEIYQVYNRKVYGYFRRNGFDHEAAEDLTQEVFCRLLRFKDTFESNDQIRNWIFKVARNLLIDVLRKKENGSAKPILMEDLPSFDTLIMDHIHVEGPEQTFVTEESNGEVMSLIEELSPRYADVIRLRELEGLKYQEIATELGMTAKAVEGLLHRARAKLKSNYTAFQRNYHSVLVGLAFVPRLLKRGTTATAKAAWNGVKAGAGKAAAVGKSIGTASFMSGTGLMSSLLAILIAGGITAGGVVMMNSGTAPASAPRAITVETQAPVALGDTLSNQIRTSLPSFSATNLDGVGTETTLPLLTGLLGVLNGQVPVIDLQGTVDTVIAQLDGTLDQVYGVVDSLLAGTTDLLDDLLSLVGTVPGLDGLTAGLVAGLSGISTEPLRNLQDQVLAGVQSVVDPVLGAVDGVLNQVTAPLTSVTSPVGAVTGGLSGGVTGSAPGATSKPQVTPPPAPTTPTDTAPAETAPTETAPETTEPAPADPNPGLLPGIYIPIISDLLPI